MKSKILSRLPIFILVVIVLGTFAIVKTQNDHQRLKTEEAADFETTQEDSVSEEDTQPLLPVRLSLVSVGDNLIHSKLYEQANDRAGGNGYDFSALYENIALSVSSADIATINQETIIAPSFPPSTYPLFNSPSEVGDEIVDIGFNIINIANNHILDKGQQGLKEAIEYWRSKDGIAMTGGYLSKEEMKEPETFVKNDIVFGLLGLTQYTNGLSLPSTSPLAFMLTTETEAIKQKIEATAKVSDVVLVNVHWGNEYSTTPTQEQKQLAYKMVEWGADIIIGHHPHVLQPIEMVKKLDGGDALIAYSLGNFVSMQNTGPRMIGGMLFYDIEKSTETGIVTVNNVRLEPLVMHYTAGFSNGVLYMLSQYSDALALNHGVKSNTSAFSYDYILDFVSGVISEEYFDKSDYES